MKLIEAQGVDLLDETIQLYLCSYNCRVEGKGTHLSLTWEIMATSLILMKAFATPPDFITSTSLVPGSEITRRSSPSPQVELQYVFPCCNNNNQRCGEGQEQCHAGRAHHGA